MSTPQQDPSAYSTQLGRSASWTVAAIIVVMAVGTAFGPLIAWTLGQYLPAPLTLSYLLEQVLLAAWRFGLGPDRRQSAPPSLPNQRPSVPASMRSTFYRAGSSTVLAWVATALFLALAPFYLQATLNTTTSTVSGGSWRLCWAQPRCTAHGVRS